MQLWEDIQWHDGHLTILLTLCASIVLRTPVYGGLTARTRIIFDGWIQGRTFFRPALMSVA